MDEDEALLRNRNTKEHPFSSSMWHCTAQEIKNQEIKSSQGHLTHLMEKKISRTDDHKGVDAASFKVLPTIKHCEFCARAAGFAGVLMQSEPSHNAGCSRTFPPSGNGGLSVAERQVSLCCKR